jgi:hypothetical protein
MITPEEPNPLPHQHILNIVMGFWQSRCLAVATELDLAEQLLTCLSCTTGANGLDPNTPASMSAPDSISRKSFLQRRRPASSLARREPEPNDARLLE